MRAHTRIHKHPTKDASPTPRCSLRVCVSVRACLSVCAVTLLTASVVTSHLLQSEANVNPNIHAHTLGRVQVVGVLAGVTL